MAEQIKCAYLEKHKSFDARAPNTKIAQLPLVEVKFELVDKKGRMLSSINGLVKVKTDGLEAADVIKQKGGIVIIEGEYLKMITFPNGFQVEYPQFYVKDGLPFGIKDGEVVWLGLKDFKINGDTVIRIQDDRQYVQDMPNITPQVKTFFSKNKGSVGGHGGAKEDNEIKSSIAMKLAERDPDAVFSYNPNTGDIHAVTPIRKDEFEFLPDDFTGRPDPPRFGFGLLAPQSASLRSIEFISEKEPLNLNAERKSEIDFTAGQREIWKRENMIIEDRVNDAFLSYSKSFISRISANIEQPAHTIRNVNLFAFDGFH